MGGGSSKPKAVTAKEVITGTGRGLCFGTSAMQGMRPNMEDVTVAVGEVAGHADHSFFAVFDGHNGATVARCCVHVLDKVLATPSWTEYCDTAMADPQLLASAMKQAFVATDAELSELNPRPEMQGSTANCAFITPSHIVVANLGDCRCVLVTTSSGPVDLSRDHKPSLPAEELRINEAGGTTFTLGSTRRLSLKPKPSPEGTPDWLKDAVPTLPSLAVSRAFGDFHWKTGDVHVVTVEPEIRVRERNAQEDTALVIACDGVWDVMSSSQCHGFVHAEARADSNWTPDAVCSRLIDHCLTSGSMDNLSAIVVRFTPE